MEVSFIRNNEEHERLIPLRKIVENWKVLDTDGYEILSRDFVEPKYKYAWKKADEYSFQAVNLGECETKQSVVTVNLTNRHTGKVYTIHLDAENLRVIGLSARERLQRFQIGRNSGKSSSFGCQGEYSR